MASIYLHTEVVESKALTTSATRLHTLHMRPCLLNKIFLAKI